MRPSPRAGRSGQAAAGAGGARLPHRTRRGLGSLGRAGTPAPCPAPGRLRGSGLSPQQRGQRSGGVPALGGASEGSRERLALGVSACARLKTAAARSSRHPGPTLSEYQAAGELPGAFCSLAFPLLKFRVGNPHRFLFRERERQGLGSQVTHKSLLPWGPSWAPSHPCRPNKGDPLKVSSLSSVFSPGEVQWYWVLCWDATSVSFSSKSPSSEGSGQPLVSKGVRTSCGRVGVTTQGQQSG